MVWETPGHAAFFRPARGHPSVVPDGRIGQVDVLGEHPDRLADREQLLAPRRIHAPVRAHRLDLQAGVPELPLDAAHRLDPVPPQPDQLVVALPGHTADHPGHPDTTPRAPGTTPSRAVNPPWKPITSHHPTASPGRERRTAPAPEAAPPAPNAQAHTPPDCARRACHDRLRQAGEQNTAEARRSTPTVHTAPHCGHEAVTPAFTASVRALARRIRRQ